jgi:hypothetical protein
VQLLKTEVRAPARPTGAGTTRPLFEAKQLASCDWRELEELDEVTASFERKELSTTSEDSSFQIFASGASPDRAP